jgi:ADP-heptose:LPS heptosyltransferase
MDIRLGEMETREVEQWKSHLPPDGGKRWIGVGIGGKKPITLWPIERYQEVLANLVQRFDCWPVIFGSAAEREAGDHLLAALGRGYNAAGSLTVRGAMMAMKACELYIGNDTGTTHMAAAAGVTCVAIFSSQGAPGLWYPYGNNHRILRTSIDCEGCGLSECIDRKSECILRIQPEEVVAACSEILQAKRYQNHNGPA